MAEITAPSPPLSRGRVLIRPPVPADVEAITAACQDPDIVRHTRVPSPYTLEHARDFVQSVREAWKTGSGANFVCLDLHTGQLTGACGLTIDHSELDADLGYWIVPDARRKRVATTAAWLVCRFGFSVLNLQRITLHAAVTNDGSNALAARLGFTHEGTLRSGHIDGPAGNAKGTRVDLSVYGLLRGELLDPDRVDA